MKKRADGRYCKQVFIGYKPDGTRKMKTIYGKTIKEVENKERQIKNDIDKGINVADEITVSEWADIWLKTFKSNIAHNTYSRYENIIEKQVKPVIGDMPINRVRLSIIQQMINNLKDDFAPATIKKIKDIMHQMFQCAIKSQYISINPTDGVDIPKLTQKNREAIPKHHVLRIEEFCKKYEHGAFIACLLYTGMRRGEILALKAKDIDFEKGVIRVNKAVEYIHNKPQIKTPKTPKSIRYIPIIDAILPYLKTAIKNKSDDDIVFANKDGEIYNKMAIHRIIDYFNKQYSEYINCEETPVHFTMHQFRHTFCTMLYEAGVDVKIAQDILGHSSINVTLEIYTHLSDNSKNISKEKINNYISSRQVAI